MTSNTRTPRWPAMTVEERTQQYSPSSMLDGPLDPYLEAYADESAVAYDAAGSVFTLSYGPLATNTTDVAIPQSDPADDRPPLHVFIHGGYWQQLSKRESFFLATACLDRGEAFAAVDYTLAPAATLEMIVDECRAAISNLRDAAETDGWADPNRMTVSGSSAGAHLAAMVACRGTATAADPHPNHGTATPTSTAGLETTAPQRPAALVLVSGIYDLEPLIDTPVNDAVNLDVESAHWYSPIRQNLSGFPPTVVAFGEHDTDEFKRQSRSFADLVRAAGSDVEEVEVKGRNHFDIVFDIVPMLTDLLPDQRANRTDA